MNISKDTEYTELKENMATLVEEYREATSLINDQMQAVIYSDLALLNDLLPRQLEKFEELQELENAFRNRLDRLFDRHYPEESRRSVTRLMDHLEEPSAELNRLRERLSEQVSKGEQLRKQLMDLLEFARDHNAETFEMITSLATEQGEGEVYDASGKRKKQSPGSVAVNHKA